MACFTVLIGGLSLENAEIILNQTLIMLILIIVGIICKKTKIITDDGNKELSKLVLTVVNPIVILMAYQTDYKPQLVKNLLIAFGLSILSYIILIMKNNHCFKKSFLK